MDIWKTVLFGLGSLIAYLIVFISSCLYFSKNKHIGAVLLLIGSLVMLIVFGINVGLSPYLFQSGHLSSAEDIQKFYMWVSYVGTFGHMCFAIGFVILILKVIRPKQNDKVMFDDFKV
ncbi:hypothetical protein E5L68_008300 [Pedobacter helvus]|uniref:Uncharacterized protein n=1 Tax=Pedobacter helvus TaxID=2563444 RepID=A0ABW9JGT6_9SPHI